jgi:hypothetical protein
MSEPVTAVILTRALPEQQLHDRHLEDFPEDHQLGRAGATISSLERGTTLIEMQMESTPKVVEAPLAPRWSATTRVAFRFCFIYFGLYMLASEQLPPLKNFVTWTAAHIFHITHRLVTTGSGSGDKIFNWVAAFCLVIIAASGTVIWTWLDRRRENYVTAHKWFHLFLRFAAGSTMLSYGVIKAIPLQMPAPGLTRLLETFGNFSPMGVLWASIGASPAYERFAGGAEMAAAVCLFVPQLSIVGALILLADSIQIFALNMTYDVPVKLFSFHLILMSLILLAPDARRLLNVLVLNRAAQPSTQPALLRGVQARRFLTAAQIVFGMWLIGVNVAYARHSWTDQGGGAPKPALYGIWNVTTMTIDGVERPPLITDDGRWRRIIVENRPGVVVQGMDDRFTFYAAKTDVAAKTIVLSTPGDEASSASARFVFDRHAPDHLLLDGTVDGHRIRLALQLFDHNRLPLLSRGFRWIQEYPFNK